MTAYLPLLSLLAVFSCFGDFIRVTQASSLSPSCSNVDIYHRHAFLLGRPQKTSTATSPLTSQPSTQLMSSIEYYYNLLSNIRGGHIEPITSLKQVQDIIQNNNITSDTTNSHLVVLDFTANNCPPCEMISPIYSELSELDEFQNKVIFLKVNVNDHPDVASHYEVEGWPTFLFFKEGKVVDCIVGGQAAKAGLYSLVARYAQ